MILLKAFFVILSMSFLGSITALVILFIKKIFRNKISPKWHYLIWMILLVRLIIPYAPESSISIFNFFSYNIQNTEEIQSPFIHNISYNSTIPNDIEADMKSNTSENIVINSLNQENINISKPVQSYSNNGVQRENKMNVFNLLVNNKNYLSSHNKDIYNESSIQFSHIASIIWLIGVCISGIYILWIQVSYSLKIANLPQCNDRIINSTYNNCKSQMNTYKKIPIIIDSDAKTPSLIGMIRPKIIISSDHLNLLSLDELRFVFMHELAHYKRKDIVIRWILVFLQSLHWFNPILWFAFNKIRQDSETACDSHVLSCIESNEYRKYVNTMIKMLTIFSGYGYGPAATGMIDGKKYIFERIKSIMNFKKHYISWSILGVALFSILSIFLLTNAKEPPKEVVRITYKGEEISKNFDTEKFKGIKAISNDELLTYDIENQEFLVITTDGSRKKTIDCNDLPKDYYGIYTVDSNDYLYVLDVKPSFKAYVYDLDGKKIKDLELELKNTNVSKDEVFKKINWDMEVDSKGNIYIMIPNMHIEILDSNGKNIRTVNANGCSFIELDEEDNLYIGGNNKTDYITKQDALNDKILWEIENSSQLVDLQQATYSKQNQCLYVADMNTILTIDSMGQSINKIFNIHAALAKDKVLLRDFIIDINKNFYFSAFDLEVDRSQLYKINLNKIHTDGSIKTLKISVRYLPSYLEYAISKFENEHPDIIINIDNHNAPTWITSDMSHAEKIELSKNEYFDIEYNFVQKLNTQMLSGKGPDILLIDNFPYRKYADKNMLLDLRELMKNDASFDKDQYYTNIFNSMEYKDKLYTIPLTVNYAAISTNTGFLEEHSIKINDRKWTWDDFLNTAKKATLDVDGNGKNDMYGVPTFDPQLLFNSLLKGFHISFIDYENNRALFNTEEFVTLLKTCKNMTQESFVNPYVTDIWPDRGGYVLLPSVIGDMNIFSIHSQLNTAEATFLQYPNSNNKIYTFIPSKMFAINNQTKYKEEAWEFIKFLISEEVQGYKKLYGIPINKNARDKSIKDYLSKTDDDINKFGSLYDYRVTSPDKLKKQINSNIKKLEKVIPKLNHCNNYDFQIQRILNDELEKYFNEENSAEKTAEIIQRKVQMYLNE